MMPLEHCQANHAEECLGLTHSGLADRKLVPFRSFNTHTALRTSSKGHVVRVIQPVVIRFLVTCLAWMRWQHALRAKPLPTNLTRNCNFMRSGKARPLAVGCGTLTT